MRVAHIVNELWLGGIQETVYALCHAMADVEHLVLFHTDGPMRASFWALPHVRLFQIRKDYRGLDALVLEHRVDIVHKQCGGGDESAFLWPLRRPDRLCAIVESMHCPRRCKTPADVVDAVLCASQYTLSHNTDSHIPAERFRLIPYGVVPVAPSQDRLSVRKAWKIPDDAIVIGRVGRLSGSKLVHETIQTALHLWQHGMTNLYGVIGGSVPKDEGPTYAQSLQRAFEQYPILRFLGEAETPEIRASWLAAMDLVCYPTQGEGFGMIFLEAIQQGIPIVTYDNGANRETVGSAGLCVPYHSSVSLRVEALAKAVQQAIKPAVLRRLRTACRDMALPYGAARFAADVKAVYDEVLAHG